MLQIQSGLHHTFSLTFVFLHKAAMIKTLIEGEEQVKGQQQDFCVALRSADTADSLQSADPRPASVHDIITRDILASYTGMEVK